MPDNDDLLTQHIDSHALSSIDTVYLFLISLVNLSAGIAISKLEPWGAFSQYILLFVISAYLLSVVGAIFAILTDDFKLRLVFWKFLFIVALFYLILFVVLLLPLLLLDFLQIRVDFSLEQIELYIVMGFVLWQTIDSVISEILFYRLEGILKKRIKTRWGEITSGKWKTFDNFLKTEGSLGELLKRSFITFTLPFIATYCLVIIASFLYTKALPDYLLAWAHALIVYVILFILYNRFRLFERKMKKRTTKKVRREFSPLRFQEDPLSSHLVRLIDLMFGLTITQGFVVYRERIVDPSLSVQNASLILVYVMIILSWIGYHTSILHYPYNMSIFSRIRLAQDIVILVFYAYLVFVGENLSSVLLCLGLIYLIYVGDGLTRILEWKDMKVSKFWLSFVFSLFFFGEYCGSIFWKERDEVLVLSALIAVFVYRIIRRKMGYGFFTIGVDVDGVLAEQVPPILSRLKEKGKGLTLKKEDIVEWDQKIDDTDISKEIEEALLDPSYIEEMPVVEGSVSGMENLHKSHHVVIVTARPLETENDTIKWLKRSFEFHEFVSSRELGKDRLGLDILIDDNLDNVKKFASSGEISILLSQPWNRNVDKDFERLAKEGKIIRCENWASIMGAINQLKVQPKKY